jgi:Tfp pilus assembly protein PilN
MGISNVTYKSQIAAQADDISKLEKQITDLRTIAQDLPKFERQNALLKKELDKAMTKLPSKPQIDEMLKDYHPPRENDHCYLP